MEVQKIDNIPYKEFIEKYYKPGIPVVFKNASKVWKAHDIFTPEYFSKNFGERKKIVNGKEYTINEILHLTANSSEKEPAPYPIKFDIPKELPELKPLLSPLNLEYAAPNWFESKIFPSKTAGNSKEVFFGGPGGKFPVAHLDSCHTNAWITQLYGEKNFIVFPRGQDEYLYPFPENKWISQVNIFNPDYEKFPKFRNATPITVTIKQGETIFVPNGIWHSAESLSQSISVIFDQVNGENYGRWMSDVWQQQRKNNLVKAAAIFLYMGATKIYCSIGDALGADWNLFS